FREHYFLGFRVEGSEKFLDQPSFDRPGVTRGHEITDDCFQPGIVAHAEDYSWSLSHFQFVNRSAGEKIAVNFHALDHVFANFLFRDLLHCGGDRSEEHTSELQSPCNLVCRLLLEKKKTSSIHFFRAQLPFPKARSASEEEAFS